MEKFDRRLFLQRSLMVGAGLLLPPQYSSLHASVLKDEKIKEENAKYIFNFSSPYYTSKNLTTPHVHIEIKELIERYTNNKVYVKIHDRGERGIGSPLSSSVKHGVSQGALISVSNLVPMIPELDILNIPFWSAGDDEYLRLIKSKLWTERILQKTENNNLKVLLHYLVGARTATSTKKYGKLIKSPEDFEGVKFRIPGSKSLEVFYKLTKALPLNLPWRLTSKAASLGRFEALDPAVIGLYAGPGGLNKELGIISEIESVHDGWVAIGNLDFIESLDHKTRIQFLDAFEEIQALQIKSYQNSKNYCIQEFKKLGVKVYTPSNKEKEILSNAFGHTNPVWEPVKKTLLGSNGLAIFDEFYKVVHG